MATRNQYANFEQVLFYLDGPQLILLEMGPKSKIVAVATDRIGDRQFFGAKVSIQQFTDYLNERFDLRFMLANPERDTWFEFDLPENGSPRILLTEVELNGERIEKYLPEHGLWARDHSEDYETLTVEVRTPQRFMVDGNWDMKEFSKFHSYLSDMYALTRSVDLFVDEQTSIDRKRSVMESFVKPWEGGGSYFGFFRSLSKAGGRDLRPDIKAIQWASPGYIDVVGDQASFDRLTALLTHFGKHHRMIVEEYEHLWSYLQETKLLKSTSRNLDRKSDIAKEVGRRAQGLSRALNITSYSEMKKMAGNDPVVAGKVLLASKRRLERLYTFFSEGRLELPGQSISS